MATELPISEQLKQKYHSVEEFSNFKDMLDHSAKKYANQYAFRLKNDKKEIYGITYSQLKHDVEALGTALIKLGLKNSPIAVIGKNSYEWAISYLAASIIGIVVPIDKELHSEDVINFLNVSESKCMIGDSKYIEALFKQKEKIANKNLLYVTTSKTPMSKSLSLYDIIENGKELIEKGDTVFSEIKIDPDALHILLFTSGTTGNAKGVCLSHRNICSNIFSTLSIVKVTQEDQVLSILPIHHTYECTLGFLLVIQAGGTISYCEGLKYINKNIEEFKPTMILCVPLLLENVHKKIMKTLKSSLPAKYFNTGKSIMDSLPFFMKWIVKAKIKKSLGGRLTRFIVGAAPMNPLITEDFFKFGIRTLQGYGLTECSPLVAGNNDFYCKYDAAGLPIPKVEYKIDHPDQDGNGEVLVKGPNVMLGYYKNEEETNKVIKDGWFYTGDLGKIDQDGYLYITGRCKTVIVTKNGKNIYPEEIEYYLNDNPYVQEALVIGVPDKKRNETYVHCKVFPNLETIKEKLHKEDITQEEIYTIIDQVIKEINQKLPNYKHIKKFYLQDKDFEKTTTQKIKRFGDNLQIH